MLVKHVENVKTRAGKSHAIKRSAAVLKHFRDFDG